MNKTKINYERGHIALLLVLSLSLLSTALIRLGEQSLEQMLWDYRFSLQANDNRQKAYSLLIWGAHLRWNKSLLSAVRWHCQSSPQLGGKSCIRISNNPQRLILLVQVKQSSSSQLAYQRYQLLTVIENRESNVVEFTLSSQGAIDLCPSERPNYCKVQ